MIFSNSELEKALILKDFMHLLVARPTALQVAFMLMIHRTFQTIMNVIQAAMSGVTESAKLGLQQPFDTDLFINYTKMGWPFL